MANVSITAANVKKTATTKSRAATLGATGTAGQAIYIDETATPQNVKLAQSDGTAAEAVGAGILLNGGAADQPCEYAYEGDIDIGGTLVIGETYVISTTAGSICPIGDLVSTNRPCILGVAITTGRLKLLPGGPFTPGVAKA